MNDGLSKAQFYELPLGAVRPAGWLRRQLELQAAGITGRLPATWPDVGDNSGWLGGTGESSERGPYYLDGLIGLAHQLRDPELIDRSQRWVDAVLASQRPDGSFGPTSDADWWPRMVAIKALAQQYDAVHDSQIVDFLRSYFAYQLAELPRRPLERWGKYRAAENALVALWYVDLTGDQRGTAVARLVLSQGADWAGFFRSAEVQRRASRFEHFTHVVNVAMALKEPAVRYLLDGDEAQVEALASTRRTLDRFHGQVHGLFSGDEWLAGRSPAQGVELCAVVEYLFSLEQTVRILGLPDLQDEIERVGFNLLPAAFDARMSVRSYHQQPNQVQATVEQRNWTFGDLDSNIYGLETNFGCCTANCHQGWPKFVRSSWLRDQDGSLALMSLAPTIVEGETLDGRPFGFEVETNYPFDDSVRIRAVAPGSFEQAIRVRVPVWAAGASAEIDGERFEMVAGGYTSISRMWRPSDTVTLRLPMTMATSVRERGSVGVRLGPIQLVHWPGEMWNRVPGSSDPGDWEVRPRRLWNRALVVPEDGALPARIERAEVGAIPFALEVGPPSFAIKGSPLQVFVPTQRVPGWGMELGSAANPPVSPTASEMPVETVPLVPYGCTRLRIAEFPTTRAEDSPARK